MSETNENSSALDNGIKKIRPYYKRYYLLYGQEEPDSQLDVKKTGEFLVDRLGYNGGELKTARVNKNMASEFDETLFDGPRCSYCGCILSGADYYELSDGRLRCPSCSNSVVKTIEEVREIYETVLKNISLYFGANINVPIDVEFISERKLLKKINKSIDKSQDILILGVAVRNKNKEYTLYIENGAPRISVIATFVHELTHIWQYKNWDDAQILAKYGPKNQLLIYEGMAKWVELQYLYLTGEQKNARVNEFITERREDEYGYGFLIYREQYGISRETAAITNSPFKNVDCPIDV